MHIFCSITLAFIAEGGGASESAEADTEFMFIRAEGFRNISPKCLRYEKTEQLTSRVMLFSLSLCYLQETALLQ